MDIEKIKRLIEDNDLTGAINLFKEGPISGEQNDIAIQLKRRLKDINEKNAKGTISEQEHQIEINKISDALITQIRDFDKRNEVLKNKKIFRVGYFFILKYALILLLFASCFIVFYFVYNSENNKTECVGLISVLDKKRDLIFKQNKDNDKVVLKIEGPHMRSVELKIENRYGDIEIVDLWIELISCRKCVPADVYIDAEYADNNYYIPLTNEVNVYKILPATYSNNNESVLIDNAGLKTYFVRFSSLPYLGYEIKLCANIYDRLTNKKIRVESKPYWYYGLKCLELKEESIDIDRFEPKIEPYLYKLMTADLWSEFSQSPRDLNQKAYCQIAIDLGVSLKELGELIENNDKKPFSGLVNYPEPFDKVLFIVAQRLHDSLK